RELVRALRADGHEVLALSRDPRRAAKLFDGQVPCFGSLHEIPQAHAVDVVVNLAGARILGWPWTAARREALLASRVDLTRALVDWMEKRERRPRLLLSASAIGYYGVQPQGDDTALDEQAPPQ